MHEPAKEGANLTAQDASGQLGMHAVIGWFDNPNEAKKAIIALRESGFSEEVISLKVCPPELESPGGSGVFEATGTIVGVKAEGKKATEAWFIFQDLTSHLHQKHRMIAGDRKETERAESPLIGLFANLKLADRAARGLIALGLTADQIEIVDLARLIAEFNPGLFQQVEPSGTGAIVGDELKEGFFQNLLDGFDLAPLFTDLGVPRNAAVYYADKIRDGFVMLLAMPTEDQRSRARKLVDDMKLQASSRSDAPFQPKPT